MPVHASAARMPHACPRTRTRAHAQLGGSIRCLAAKADLTFAGVGRDIVECKRVHRCVRVHAAIVARTALARARGAALHARLRAPAC